MYILLKKAYKILCPTEIQALSVLGISLGLIPLITFIRNNMNADKKTISCV
jgi:hypothetical protein